VNTPNYEVARSRMIRQTVLRIVAISHQAAPGVVVLARQIYESLATGMVRYTQSEVDVELAYMASAKLLETVSVASGRPMPEPGYRLTNAGLDFWRAECPWTELEGYLGRGGGQTA
jgi:hypothetical protein